MTCTGLTGKRTLRVPNRALSLTSAATFFRNRAPGPPPFSSMSSTPAVRRTELTASETKLTRINNQAIRRVLETAGVEFR
jgi:hypothetical protein